MAPLYSILSALVAISAIGFALLGFLEWFMKMALGSTLAME